MRTLAFLVCFFCYPSAFSSSLLEPSDEDYRVIRQVHRVCGVLDLNQKILDAGENYQANDNDRACLIGAYLCSIKILSALQRPLGDDAWAVLALRSEVRNDSLIEEAEKTALLSAQERIGRLSAELDQGVVEISKKLFSSQTQTTRTDSQGVAD